LSTWLRPESCGQHVGWHGQLDLLDFDYVDRAARGARGNPAVRVGRLLDAIIGADEAVDLVVELVHRCMVQR
jgi:hypothetical protein